MKWKKLIKPEKKLLLPAFGYFQETSSFQLSIFSFKIVPFWLSTCCFWVAFQLCFRHGFHQLWVQELFCKVLISDFRPSFPQCVTNILVKMPVCCFTVTLAEFFFLVKLCWLAGKKYSTKMKLCRTTRPAEHRTFFPLWLAWVALRNSCFLVYTRTIIREL